MIVLVTCACAVALTALFVLDGVVLKLLWGWFLVPTLGLPTISLVQAIGIGVTINFLTYQHIPRDKDEERKMCYSIIVAPVFFLACGWVIHLFM